jgi:PBP1b-binding outer membrane lipoprotein LpoB
MRFSKSVLIAFAAAMLLCSCSSGDDEEKEKGKIEAMTEKAGQEAVKAIKTPIEKAQTVADKEAQRAKEMEERKQE